MDLEILLRNTGSNGCMEEADGPHILEKACRQTSSSKMIPYPDKDNSISQTVGMQEPYCLTMVQGYPLEILHIFSFKRNWVSLLSCTTLMGCEFACITDTLPGSHPLWFSSLLSYIPFPWWGKHQNCSPCTISLFFHQGMSPPQSHSK